MRMKKKVLIFSVDRDLAWSLAMLLDDQFDMVCETNVQTLSERIAVTLPDLLIIDMPYFGSGVLTQLKKIKARWQNIPILMLRDYRKGKKSSEDEIRRLAAEQLYKPMEVQNVARAINQLIPDDSLSGLSPVRDH